MTERKLVYYVAATIDHYIAREDAADFVRQLKQRSGGAIYLCGGGQLAGSLLDQELIDELIIKLHPVAFGRGIALFGNSMKGFGLTMNSANVYPNGVMYLRYTIGY